MTKVLVAIGQCRDPVLQNVAFVVESIQTLFLDFDCLEDVVGRLEFAKLAGCRLLGSENVQKMGVVHVLSDVRFFIPLARIFDSFGL